MYNPFMLARPVPTAIFDCHLHIIDPRFPLQPNHGYTPLPFSCDDYRQRISSLPVIGGAVVSGSFQAFDQHYLVAALRELGPGYVGVTQLPHDVSDQQILELDRQGVRALRFNVKRGGSGDIAHFRSLAWRVHEIAGWHVEFYIDSQQLDTLGDLLSQLPAISIDHLGLSRAGLHQLLGLVEGGARVKATGFSRCDLDIKQTLRQIAAINPRALMFGTDLPCTRAPRIWDPRDLEILCNALDEALLPGVLAGNALEFYRARRARPATPEADNPGGST
jgi:predicted TIM-barrel fold metal-dependent hydrolase